MTSLNDARAPGREESTVENHHESIDEALDAALELTFPASDPIALFMHEYDGWNDASIGESWTALAGAGMVDAKA